MPNLILGSTTVITENAGTATINASLQDASIMPKGVSQGVGYLLVTQTGTSSTAIGFTPGGTGEKVFVWNERTNGLSDNTWANPILTLDASGYFTMAIGYYNYLVCLPSVHSWMHWGLAGVRRYGEANGSGSTLYNVTETEVSFGQTFGYAHNGSVNDGLLTPGLLKVTSTTQKYAITWNNQNNTQHSTYLPHNQTTARVIQAWASFLKIG